MDNQNGFNVPPSNEFNNAPMNNQAPQQGNAVIGGLLVILLIICAVVGILFATGKIDFNLNKDEDTEEKESNSNNSENKADDYEAMAKNLCEKRNARYMYNEDVVDLFREALMTDDAGKSWDIIKDKEFCYGSECYLFKNKNLYHYDCLDKKLDVKKWEPIVIRSEIYLENGCANINSKGNYMSGDEGDTLVCSDFVCRVTINGREFTRNCEH